MAKGGFEIGFFLFFYKNFGVSLQGEGGAAFSLAFALFFPFYISSSFLNNCPFFFLLSGSLVLCCTALGVKVVYCREAQVFVVSCVGEGKGNHLGGVQGIHVISGMIQRLAFGLCPDAKIFSSSFSSFSSSFKSMILPCLNPFSRSSCPQSSKASLTLP